MLRDRPASLEVAEGRDPGAFPSGWGPSKGRVSAASPLAFLEEALVPRDRLVSLEEVPVSLVGGVHLSQ